MSNPMVLLVEDDDMLRTMFTYALTRAGLHVVAARDGLEALDVARRETDAIRFLCLDVDLPGLDGPSVVRRLRADGSTARFCFMTGGGIKYTRTELMEYGADEVLEKPFPIRALLALAGRGCELPEADGGGRLH